MVPYVQPLRKQLCMYLEGLSALFPGLPLLPELPDDQAERLDRCP